MSMACTTLSFLILKSCNGVGDELDFWPQEWSYGTVVVYMETAAHSDWLNNSHVSPWRTIKNFDTISVTLSKEVSSFTLG